MREDADKMEEMGVYCCQNLVAIHSLHLATFNLGLSEQEVVKRSPCQLKRECVIISSTSSNGD